MHVILQAEQVAAARSASPYRPIVALVRADDPAEAIAAQLAGATVVLPCADPSVPDPDEVDAAVAAAVALTSRQRRGEDEVGDAAHRFASNASAVGMVAHLLGASGGRRTEQLRSLADQGAALAWRASRGTRTGGRPLAEVDLADLVRGLAAGTPGEGIEVTASVAPSTPTVLADREGLERTLTSLVDNARRAGAEHVTVSVSSSVSAGSEGVVVEVRDDGSGLPAGWTGALAC